MNRLSLPLTPALATSEQARRTTAPVPAQLPTVSGLLLRWFTWYSRRYLRRHFHSLRVSRAGGPPESSGFPLVLYSNHASWWDPLVCLVLKDEFFAGRTAYAPIDAGMLARYGFFRRIGFFGVEQHTRRGSVQFLRTAEAVLQSSQALLAITPQGRFMDVRERPVQFEAGLGHLAARVQRALFVPVAAEYVFWEERLPEILVRFGAPVVVRPADPANFGADDWTRRFELELTSTQEALAEESKRRGVNDFQIVLRGGAGQGGIYDAWRSFRAKVRREPFTKEHGDK
jgi:1-acyl-sn-glycerol-3-phosphate acyltransferase